MSKTGIGQHSPARVYGQSMVWLGISSLVVFSVFPTVFFNIWPMVGPSMFDQFHSKKITVYMDDKNFCGARGKFSLRLFTADGTSVAVSKQKIDFFINYLYYSTITSIHVVHRKHSNSSSSWLFKADGSLSK